MQPNEVRTFVTTEIREDGGWLYDHCNMYADITPKCIEFNFRDPASNLATAISLNAEYHSNINNDKWFILFNGENISASIPNPHASDPKPQVSLKYNGQGKMDIKFN